MPDPGGFVRCLGVLAEMPTQTGPSEEARLRCILSPLQMKRVHGDSPLKATQALATKRVEILLRAN